MAITKKKVLVSGSYRVSKDDATNDSALKEIANAGEQIGAALAQRGFTICIGSDDTKDVDPYVVKGALQADGDCEIEVHIPLGGDPTYDGHESVRTLTHQFEDWDVTVMDTIEDVDGIIVIGGAAGVVHAGVSGWKMGKPVIPIGSFGGGGKTVWNYGSATRQKFYRNALSDPDIDRLAGPWTEKSAEHAVDSLEAVARRAAFATSSMPVLIGTMLVTLFAAVGWILTLMLPYWGNFPGADIVQGSNGASEVLTGDARLWLIGGFFASIVLAGLLGAAMQTLRRVRDGRRIDAFRSVIDIVLGITAGLITAMLFLIAQIAVQGTVAFEWNTADYSRIVLLSSTAALFASLYLDSALSRFDTVKDSVMTGTYQG